MPVLAFEFLVVTDDGDDIDWAKIFTENFEEFETNRDESFFLLIGV